MADLNFPQGALPVNVFNDLSSNQMAVNADGSIPVSIGLPTYLEKSFGYSIGINQPTAGVDNPLIYLKNPTGSGKTIYLRFLSYGIPVANVLGTVRIYKNPTTTANGTARTIVPFGTAATVVQIFTVPTVTTNGDLLASLVDGQNAISVAIDWNYEISIAANSTVLITGNPGSNNRQAEISLRWIEV